MYKKVSVSVDLPDGMTNTFETNIGVKQGCILSPTLFSKPFRILPDLLKTITFVLPIFTLRFHLSQ
jgi:hypothetical protein